MRSSRPLTWNLIQVELLFELKRMKRIYLDGTLVLLAPNMSEPSKVIGLYCLALFEVLCDMTQ